MNNNGKWGIKNILIVVFIISLLAIFTLAVKFKVEISRPQLNYWNNTGDLEVHFNVVNDTSLVNVSQTNNTYSCTIVELITNSVNFTFNSSTTATVLSEVDQTVNLSGIPTSTSINGWEYYVSCLNGTQTYNTSSRYYKVDRNLPIVTRVYPLVKTNQSNNSLKLIYSVQETLPERCRVEVNSVISREDSIVPNTSTTHNIKAGVIDLSRGSNLVDIRCFEQSGLADKNGTNVSVFVDTESPNLTLISPDSLVSNNSQKNVNFTVKVVDQLVSSCILYLNMTSGEQLFANQTDSIVANNTYTNFTLPKIADGNRYNWSIRCNDSVGNIASLNGTLSVDNSTPGDLLYASPLNNSFQADLTPEIVWYSAPDSNIDHYEVKVFYPNSTLYQTQNVNNGTRNAVNVTLPGYRTRMLVNVTSVDKAGNRNGSSNGTLSLNAISSCADLKTGWNYCANIYNVSTNLSDLAIAINPAVDQITFINSSKALNSYIPGVSTNADLEVNRGDVLLVHVTANVSWEKYRIISTDLAFDSNVTLTNSSTGSTSWNYLAIENRSDSGVSFQEIEDIMNSGTNNFNDLVIPTIVYINSTGVYPYVLGLGEPWNLTRVYYGDFLYLGVDTLNATIVMNRSGF